MGQAAGREGARPRGTCARAGGRRGVGGSRRLPNFVRARAGAGRRSCGATGPGAPPALRVGFVCGRVGSSPRGRGDLAACGWPGTPEPAFRTARSRDGRWLRARRGRAGRSRQERRSRRHVPAGRAARAEGGGHGGDYAPPPIVPGLGLGPRAASPLAAPPLSPEPGRGACGTQRTAGVSGATLCSGLGAAARRAAAQKRAGGVAASGAALL